MLLLPKFLTPEIAELAITSALHATIEMPEIRATLPKPTDPQCHIVILVPAMEDARDQGYPKWPAYNLEPHCLCQRSVGDKTKWTDPLDEVAQCKALQLWHGRNEGGTDIVPHLLFPSDTRWWGGVKRNGIVVTCSGFHCHQDKMLAGLIADLCIGLSYNEWVISPDHKDSINFLG